MKKISTKESAEAVLRELPSVLGACVREDVFGHPREVHLLVGPGPNPRHLARDIRDLLQERLGIPIDQRVISIAQLAESMGRVPPARQAAAPPGPPAVVETPDPEPRLVYRGIESVTRDGRIHVRVRLGLHDREVEGEGLEVDGGLGRIRATASATLRAAGAACNERVRLDLETASLARALGRDYVLVAARAASPRIGRRPLSLVGAQPLESGAEIAAVLAALQATNRVLALGLAH